MAAAKPLQPILQAHAPAKRQFQWIAYGGATPASIAIIDRLKKPSAALGTVKNFSSAILQHLEQTAASLDTLDPMWRNKIAIVPENLAYQLSQIAYQCSQNYCKTLLDEIPRIQRLATLFRRNNKPCAWPDVAHVLVAGLVIDMGLRDELLRCRLILSQPEDFWIWIFEGGTGAKHRFGVRARGHARDRALFRELWHEGTQRTQQLKVDISDLLLLRRLSEHASGMLRDLTHTEQRQALKLAFFGLCKRQDGGYVANVPFIAGPQQQSVCTEVARICSGIMEGSVRAAMDEAIQVYASEFSRRVEDVFKHAFARLLLEHAMDRVMEENLLPPFPDLVDYSWGCWLTGSNDERGQ